MATPFGTLPAPPSPPRATILGLIAVGAFTATLAAAVAEAAGWGGRYVLGCVAGYTLIAGAAGFGLRRHRPRARFRLASWITLARAVPVSAITGLLAVEAVGPAPAWGWAVTGAAVVALSLDGVDGWVARRLGHTTRFGALWDQELDAFFILVLSVLAWRLDQAGAWVLLIGGMRYLFLLAGRAWPALARPLPPSPRRKAVCVLQVVALLVALAPPVGPAPASGILATALAALAYSFAADMVWLLRGRAAAHGAPS